MIGRIVSHYEILARLGSGGMGDVYRARDRRLDRTVVLKFLPPGRADDDAARQRFVREAQAASRLDHAGICTIYDIDELDDGTQFICMAYCDGENLAERLATGPLPPAEAARIALRVAEGLACAHDNGVVHRDLKPSNVQLTSQNEVKILDFGVARLAGQERITMTGLTVGTPAYMAPEQIRNQGVDHRCDLWALGALLYEMLTGQRPFHGDDPVALMRVIAEEPAPDPATLAPGTPEDLVNIVRWCLEKDPEDRPARAADLIQPLSLHARLSDDATMAVTTPASATRRRRSGRGRLVAVSAVLVAVALGLATCLWPRSEPRRGVALLPWAVVGDGETGERFGDGLVAYLSYELLLLGPAQPDGWVVPPNELRSLNVASWDRARGRLGVGRAVSGTLHLQGEVLRLELLLHESGGAGGSLLNIAPRRETIRGSRDELVAWTDEVLETLVAMLGWRLPPGRGQAPVAGTHSDAALAAYITGLGATEAMPGRSPDRAAAAAAYREALSYDRDFAAPRVWLGRLLANGLPPAGTSDRAAALAQVDTALRAAPELLDAHFLRGWLRLDQGEATAAAADFRRCLELVPGLWLAQHWLAKCYLALDEPDSAEAVLQRGLARRPDDPVAHLELGNVYYNEGRYEAAAESFRRVVELAPDRVDGYINLAGTSFALGRWDEAETIYQQSLAIEPDPDAYTNLGTIAFYDRRLGEAGRMYEQASRLDPDNPLALGWAAESYWWSGTDRERARELYARAAAVAESSLVRDPHDRETAMNLASYLIRLGETDRATKIIDEVAAAEPRDQNVLYMLAVCHEDLGHRDRAIAYLEQALERGFVVQQIAVNPAFDKLRQSEQYEEMLTRIRSEGQRNP